ncbi:AEC family transporter [Saccharococcus sp. Marseille-Q5394]|uniref:AEC family transporter n=1 Tax=Saccharococcus sp. Marseille-Q5394 TaxID=2972778 RepID=UPI0021C69C1B|nr:AEC family transporter [Saccharococcus sp. Marseille-Q5394]
MLILVVLGAGLQRKFAFNLKAVSNLITYCLMPAAVFINLYETEIDVHVLLEIISYLFAFSLAIIIVTTILSKFLKLDRGETAIFKNSISLINSGNYGIPVSQLLFHANPLGISIQIIVMVFQNVLTYTYGLYNLISATKSGLEILRSLLKMPVIHAMLLGGLLNWLQIPIPNFIWVPISHLSDAFLAIALILLGAQLAQIELKTIVNRTIVTSSIGRLLIGPSVALLLIFLFGLDGVVAQSLFIASSFPTSRNSSTLALEYDVHPDLAAQTVLFSTIVSAITVTFVVYLSGILFV